MAFFLLTKDCSVKVGIISEKYHMFSEDRDFCYKARRKDYKLIYDPSLFLSHIAGASSKVKWNSRELLRIKNESDRLFIKENYKGIELLFLLFTNWLRKQMYFIKTISMKDNTILKDNL